MNYNRSISRVQTKTTELTSSTINNAHTPQCNNSSFIKFLYLQLNPDHDQLLLLTHPSFPNMSSKFVHMFLAILPTSTQWHKPVVFWPRYISHCDSALLLCCQSEVCQKFLFTSSNHVHSALTQL